MAAVATNSLTDVLAKRADEMRARAESAMEQIATLLTEYARMHHPWQNRTGETERTTVASITEVSAEVVRITLRTGTPYASFLELASGGKWAWLWPTMLACEAQILAILKSVY